MTTQERRARSTKIAFGFLGTPYIWGGDDPSGFDCSGFVVELLKSVGVLPRVGDWTAGALLDRFKGKTTLVPAEGCLALWRNAAGAVTHVEYIIDDELTIGASGGDSDNVDVSAAWRDNAYIKVRPFSTRGGAILFVDPFA